ncbi:YbaB/EbfC family nucleoid-associated protein [Nocardia sp. NPDC052566]|uniref:YbaB/EbfC family nucleoid-associated protein n=1 Tax=Nocardia sp. NPDC052566 TaxID=3364330 RepID=UPI0037C8739F
MTNDFAKAELASVLSEVKQQFRSIAQVQQARVQLTASATVRKRVTVTVNAEGTIIETKFGSGIEELSFPEIARAVTAAAQQASAEVARKNQELMAPLHDRRARLPKLSELIDGLPDFGAEAPKSPPVPLLPTGAAGDENDSTAMEFRDVEAMVPNHDRGVTDSVW